MTTLRETAINKPLTGLELGEIIRRDMERVIQGEGSLSAHIAYGRVGYEIILRIHTGNPYMPVTENSVRSRPDVATPEVEAPPLVDAPADASIGGTTLTRNITSPNAERVREGLPVPVEVRQQDGTKTVENVVYPKAKDAGDGDVTVVDSTNEAKAAWRR